MVLETTADANQPLVLFVSPVSDVGGVARHFTDIQKYGIPGFRLHFALPAGPLADVLEKSGAEVTRLSFGPKAGVFASWKSLSNLVAQTNPTFVHSHLAYADFISAMVLRPKIRRISTEHGIAGGSVYHANYVSNHIRKALHRARLTRFELVIAVSRSTAEQMNLQWKPKVPIKIIYNGVDKQRSSKGQLKKSKDDPLRLLTISRLSHEKQVDLAIRAMQVLKSRGVKARLTVAGEGPEKPQLQALAVELNVAEAVDFPGVVDSIKGLSEVDVVVQLSKWENCSYTLLDARVRGLGIVATAVGGNPELVNQGSLLHNPTAESIANLVMSGNLNMTPNGWPSVSDMCVEISSAYGELL